MQTKSQHAAFVAKGLGHESFEHHYEGRVTTYDVTLTREKAKQGRFTLRKFDMRDIPIAEIRNSRVYETARILELTAEQADEPLMMVVSVANGEEYHLLIDGIHRLLRRLMDNQTHVYLFLIPEAEAVLAQPGWGSVRGTTWGENIIGGVIQR